MLAIESPESSEAHEHCQKARIVKQEGFIHEWIPHLR